MSTRKAMLACIALGWLSLACGGNAPPRTEPLAPFVKQMLSRPGYEWSSYDAQNFHVHARRGSHAAQQVAQFAAALGVARDSVFVRLGIVASDTVQRPHVFVVNAPADLVGLVGQPAGGWTEPAANAVIVAADSQVAPPLRHELAHLYSHRLWGKPFAAWLSEGVAVYGVGHCGIRSLHAWAAAVDAAGLRQPLPELERAFDFSKAAPHLQAGSIIQFVAERYGMAAVQTLWRSGLSASTAATQLDADALEQAWLQTIRQHDRDSLPSVTGRIRCETMLPLSR